MYNGRELYSLGSTVGIACYPNRWCNAGANSGSSIDYLEEIVTIL